MTRDEVVAWLRGFAAEVAANRDELNALDAAIGDADHGSNLHRGMQAVSTALPSLADPDIGVILKRTGMTLVSTVGGASGPLYGTFFMELGTAWTGKSGLSLDDWVAGFEEGVAGVIRRGKAQVGDKTMIDALQPALRELKAAKVQGTSLPDALDRAAAAGEQGALATIPLVARRGRASYLAERSAGHEDPGAASTVLLLRAAAKAVAGS